MSESERFPYPRGLGRSLLRLPLILYRLGFGDLLSAGRIMILGTRGRTSGQTRYTPIEYRHHGSKTYVVSGWGARPQWLQNLRAEPDVLVQQGRRQFGARATIVTNAGEALRVLHLFRRQAPFLYDWLLARISSRERVDAQALPDISREVTIVRFDPNPEPSALRPLPADYPWVGPLLVVVGLIAALAITRGRRRTA